LPDGKVIAALMSPCLKLMSAAGQAIWTVPSPLAIFNDRPDAVRVSADGRLVDFDFGDATKTRLRFDVRSLSLDAAASNDILTLAPQRDRLKIDDWRNGRRPTLNGQAIPIRQDDISRSLAIAPDGKRFFLGSTHALAAFDDTGAIKWRRETRDDVFAVNASMDGQLAIAAYGDGTIRWHRADNGRELLALQVLPNGKEPAEWDWVLWTPEGFYEATSGADEALKWVINHGPDKAVTTRPVKAFQTLHRPDGLKILLDELDATRGSGSPT
jgi:outer membrane protein assembly factor BamB